MARAHPSCTRIAEIHATSMKTLSKIEAEDEPESGAVTSA